ncbi:hypothetical protein HKX48_009270 [Thoreauomyces humboldtii]|nr:hypothetical protein HKX48_009270 [Thoreauomyces humboldtii]
MHSLLPSIFVLLLPLSASLTLAVPSLYNITCTPTDIPLGTSVNITWSLNDTDTKHPSRGVFSWQIYAQHALTNETGTGNVPIDGPASTNLLTDDGISAEFDWYTYGPLGVADWTGQRLCLTTSMPYGPSVDALGNPAGYTTQTFCPLDCTILPPTSNYTYFESVSFTPATVRLGESLHVRWNYSKGLEFPKDVMLSIFFSSTYYEILPQYVIAAVPAAPGRYAIEVGQSLLDFVTTNAQESVGFPYRLYLELSFPPQTNALGGLVAPGNLTVLGIDETATDETVKGVRRSV